MVWDWDSLHPSDRPPRRRVHPWAAKLERMSSDLLRAASALRHFLHVSGALRAHALVDATPPAWWRLARLGPIEIVVGDEETELPHGAELPAPPDLGEIRQLPPFAVDPVTGEVTGTLGGLDHLGDAVSRLAAALGGRSAAVAEFETITPDVPLVLSARAGEPVLVVLGEDEYELQAPR